MIRIGRVTLNHRDNAPCVYRAILENGVAVLSMWRLDRITLDGRYIYERVG